MKKGILLLTLCSGLFFSSCASNAINKAQVQTGTQVRGEWTLSSVNYIGLKANENVNRVFDLASPACYEGSTWSLNQNSKKGTYTFNNYSPDCPTGTAEIMWNVQQMGDASYFTFKDVTGIKAKQNTAGYQMRIESVDATSMKLVQDVNFEGKIIQIVYTFHK